MLNDTSPDVRRIAVEALGLHAKPGDARVAEALIKALGDSEPAVRRAGALALGRVGGEGAAGSLVNHLQADRGGDVFLKDGYLRALERLGKPGIEALLSLAASGDKERDLAVESFLGLRTKAAADALPELLLRPDLTIAQREALVRSYTNYQADPPMPLDALVAYLARRPDEPLEIVRAALEVFAASGEANAKKASPLVFGMLDKPDDDVRYVAIKAVEDMRLAAAAPRLIELLSDSSKRESERAAIVKALRVLNDKKAVPPIQALLAGTNPATLKVEALRSLAALDATAARTEAEKLLDQPDPMLLGEAVAVLGGDQAGGEARRRALRREEVAARLLPASDRGAQEVRRRPGDRETSSRSAPRRTACCRSNRARSRKSASSWPRRATRRRAASFI